MILEERTEGLAGRGERRREPFLLSFLIACFALKSRSDEDAPRIKTPSFRKRNGDILIFSQRSFFSQVLFFLKNASMAGAASKNSATTIRLAEIGRVRKIVGSP